MHKIAVVLLHYPVTNRAGEPVTTAVTNMDIHDISRSCRTYEVDHYYLVNPIPGETKSNKYGIRIALRRFHAQNLWRDLRTLNKAFRKNILASHLKW